MVGQICSMSRCLENTIKCLCDTSCMSSSLCKRLTHHDGRGNNAFSCNRLAVTQHANLSGFAAFAAEPYVTHSVGLHSGVMAEEFG